MSDIAVVFRGWGGADGAADVFVCHSRAMALPSTPGAMRAMQASLSCALLLLALAGCAGQRPQEATVPGPSRAPNDGAAPCNQVGIASWYRGSSRDRASSQDLVAAHRSLPFGTSVQVTAIETGHSVVVRINDRGPFGRGRIIDLSRVAADQLGIRQDGVARVRLELVGSAGEGCPFQLTRSD
jgi:rare lipoprotein A